MSAPAKVQALEALIDAHAIELKLPTVRRHFRALAEEATRDQQIPTSYLAALLEAEVAERAERRERRRLIDARFPMIKRLEDFSSLRTPRSPRPRSPRWPKEPGSMTASRSSCSATRGLARHISLSHSQSSPASKDAEFASPPSQRWRTGCRPPRRAASSAGSSHATPAPSSSSSTNSDTSRYPKAPPNWSSKSSPNATSAPR